MPSALALSTIVYLLLFISFQLCFIFFLFSSSLAAAFPSVGIIVGLFLFFQASLSDRPPFLLFITPHFLHALPSLLSSLYPSYPAFFCSPLPEVTNPVVLKLKKKQQKNPPEITGIFYVSAIALTATRQDAAPLLLHVLLVAGHAGPGTRQLQTWLRIWQEPGELSVPGGVWQANHTLGHPAPCRQGGEDAQRGHRHCVFPLGRFLEVISR